MSSDRVDAESTVSGNQANIPGRIRRELDIDDGDHLRWHLEDDGSARVQVVQQRTGTFDEFDATAVRGRPMSRLATTCGASMSSRCREPFDSLTDACAARKALVRRYESFSFVDA